MDLINLQHLCAVRIASIIWERPNIKLLIRDYFAENEEVLKKVWNKYFPQNINQDSLVPLAKEIEIAFLKLRILHEGHTGGLFIPMSEIHYQKFQLVIYSVLQHLELLTLPTVLKIYIQNIAGEMGHKIYKWVDNWLNFVTQELNLDFEFVIQIYWTPYGTLDETKIMKMWLKNNQFRSHISSGYESLINMACFNVQEDFIIENQQAIEKIIQTDIPKFNLSYFDDKVYTLTALYLHLYLYVKDEEGIFNEQENLCIFRDPDLSNSKYIIAPEEMFKMCIVAGLPKGASYFWNILNTDEHIGGSRNFFRGGHTHHKEEKYTNLGKNFWVSGWASAPSLDTLLDKQCLLDACASLLIDSSGGYPTTEKMAETLLFYINQMSVQHRNEYLQENIVELFRSILHEWPFSEIIIFELIDNYFPKLSIWDYEIIFFDIFYLDDLTNYLVAFGKMQYFRMVLKKIFEQMPLQLKTEFLRKNVVRLVCDELNVLPFSDFLFELIDNFSSNVSIVDYQTIAYSILVIIRRKSGELKCVKLFQYYYLVFEKIFGDLTQDMKKQIFNCKFFDENSGILDTTCLNIILRNMDTDCRLDTITKINFRKLFFGRKGKIERLHQFMNETLLSDEEKKFCKEYLLSLTEDLLADLEMDDVDKLFDYFFSKEEKIMEKNKINCVKICEILLEDTAGEILIKRYDKADKFLEWMFSDKKERDKFRYSLNKKHFVFNRMSKSWDEYLSFLIGTKRRRSSFLKFLFGMPEETKFVRNKWDFLDISEKLDELLPSYIYAKILSFKRSEDNVWRLNPRVNLAEDLYHGRIYKGSNIPDLFMKWFCKEEKRIKFIKRKYKGKEKRDFFNRLVCLMLSFVKSENKIK